MDIYAISTKGPNVFMAFENMTGGDQAVYPQCFGSCLN